MIPASYAPREPPPESTKPIRGLRGRSLSGCCTKHECTRNRPPRHAPATYRTDGCRQWCFFAADSRSFRWSALSKLRARTQARMRALRMLASFLLI